MNNTATRSTQAKPAPFKSGVNAGDNGPGGIFNPDVKAGENGSDGILD